MSVWVLHCMKLPCQGGKKEVKPVLIHLASHPFSNSHQSPHGLAEALRLGSQVLSHYKASSNKKGLISKPASLTTVLNYLATPSTFYQSEQGQGTDPQFSPACPP